MGLCTHFRNAFAGTPGIFVFLPNFAQRPRKERAHFGISGAHFGGGAQFVSQEANQPPEKPKSGQRPSGEATAKRWLRPKEAPLFAMPRRSLGPPETAERSEAVVKCSATGFGVVVDGWVDRFLAWVLRREDELRLQGRFLGCFVVWGACKKKLYIFCVRGGGARSSPRFCNAAP